MPRRNAVVVCLCGILQNKHNMFVMLEFIRALSREYIALYLVFLEHMFSICNAHTIDYKTQQKKHINIYIITK